MFYLFLFSLVRGLFTLVVWIWPRVAHNLGGNPGSLELECVGARGCERNRVVGCGERHDHVLVFFI